MKKFIVCILVAFCFSSFSAISSVAVDDPKVITFVNHLKDTDDLLLFGSVGCAQYCPVCTGSSCPACSKTYCLAVVAFDPTSKSTLIQILEGESNQSLSDYMSELGDSVTTALPSDGYGEFMVEVNGKKVNITPTGNIQVGDYWLFSASSPGSP